MSGRRAAFSTSFNPALLARLGIPQTFFLYSRFLHLRRSFSILDSFSSDVHSFFSFSFI
jgi:hypothetical protein